MVHDHERGGPKQSRRDYHGTGRARGHWHQPRSSGLEPLGRLCHCPIVLDPICLPSLVDCFLAAMQRRASLRAGSSAAAWLGRGAQEDLSLPSTSNRSYADAGASPRRMFTVLSAHQQQQNCKGNNYSPSRNVATVPENKPTKKKKRADGYKDRLNPKSQRHGVVLKELDPARFERMRLILGYCDLPETRDKPGAKKAAANLRTVTVSC